MAHRETSRLSAWAPSPSRPAARRVSLSSAGPASPPAHAWLRAIGVERRPQPVTLKNGLGAGVCSAWHMARYVSPGSTRAAGRVFLIDATWRMRFMPLRSTRSWRSFWARLAGRAKTQTPVLVSILSNVVAALTSRAQGGPAVSDGRCAAHPRAPWPDARNGSCAGESFWRKPGHGST